MTYQKYPTQYFFWVNDETSGLENHN